MKKALITGITGQNGLGAKKERCIILADIMKRKIYIVKKILELLCE